VAGASAQTLRNVESTGQTNASAPSPKLAGVELEELLGNQVPGDREFRDLKDAPLHLRELFQGDKPILLTLNYATCPKLCGLQLRGLADALSGLAIQAGSDYEMITISLDPNEKAEQTIAVRDGFIGFFPDGFDKSAWHFLRGQEADIRAVADSVGFAYTKDEETGEYNHPALAMVLSPSGEVLRYIKGLMPEPSTLRLAMAEAAQGKQGISLGDRVLLFCYSYDSGTGRYTLAVWRLMRSAAVLTILSLLGGFWMLQRSSAKEEQLGEENQ